MPSLWLQSAFVQGKINGAKVKGEVPYPWREQIQKAEPQETWGLVSYHGYLPLSRLWNVTVMPSWGPDAFVPGSGLAPLSFCPQDQACARGEPHGTSDEHIS